MVDIRSLLPAPPLYSPAEQLVKLRRRELEAPQDPEIQLEAAFQYVQLRDSYLVAVVCAARYGQVDQVEELVRAYAAFQDQIRSRLRRARELVQEQERCAAASFPAAAEVKRDTRPVRLGRPA